MSEPLPFVIDRRATAPAAWNDPEQQPKHVAGNDTTSAEVSRKKPRKRAAAWVDEDDGEDEVNLVERRRMRKFRKQLGERKVSAAEYADRIRHFYAEKVAVKTGGTGSWASLAANNDHSDESESDSDLSSEEDDVDNTGLSDTVQRLLQKSGNVMSRQTRRSAQALVAKKKNILLPGSISIRKMQNVNAEAPNKSISSNVEFHPSGKLVLTAGVDRTLRIFQVDGRHNAKVQGVKLSDLAISSAHFTNGGDAVVLSGKQRHLYKFDMNSGTIARLAGVFKDKTRGKNVKALNDIRNQFVTTKDGSMLAFLSDSGRVTLVADKTMQQIGHLHVSGQLTSAAFDPVDSNSFYTTSRTGVVHLWDIRRMECVDQLRDEGAVHSTSIGVSPIHFAAGGDTGIVNVYEKTELGVRSQKDFGNVRTGSPAKAISNLTTSISQTVFNHDGKILAIASRTVRDAIRLVHTPSMTVFSNWPTPTVGIRRIQALAFSPGGGYLAIGNDRGDALLYRLPAYPAN